jgi:hypothetical protein
VGILRFDLSKLSLTPGKYYCQMLTENNRIRSTLRSIDMSENTHSLKVVFMGTPEFAVASLEAILKAGYEVKAVVTVPDKPAGRGRQPMESAVKQFAVQKGLPVLQPEKLRDEIF